MKVISCGTGDTKAAVTPESYNACTFEIIEKWDETQHAKTCDTMFYLQDGTGAYVWDCDKWKFLDFSGATQSDWNAKENEAGGIKNKPFKKLGEGLEIDDNGDLKVSDDYATKNDLDNVKRESQKNVIDQIIGSTSYTETITLDFTDKISNSVVENSNKLIHSSDIILLDPTVGSEATQSLYDRISTQDGTVGTFSISKKDFMKQVVLQFNILENLKKRLGEKFFIDRGAIDTVSQVEVLKDIVKATTNNIWGYGNGPSGNKLSVKRYANDKWEDEALESDSNFIVKLSQSLSGIPFITPDGWLYIVVYAEASDGFTASSIYIDYVNVELTIELSANDQIKKIVEQNNENLLTKEEKESGFMVMRDIDITNQDLNDITELGFYYLKGATGLNRPGSEDPIWGHMMVISKGSSTVVQQIYDATNGGIDVYVRTKTGVPQQWSDWKRITT